MIYVYLDNSKYIEPRITRITKKKNRQIIYDYIDKSTPTNNEEYFLFIRMRFILLFIFGRL